MNADRVDVFHVADDDGVVVAVAHYFVLDFLEAGDRFFQQTLCHR